MGQSYFRYEFLRLLFKLGDEMLSTKIYPSLILYLLLQFENMVSFDIQNVTDDHFIKTLTEELTSQCGEIRFTKLIHEMIWVAFVNNEHALEAIKLGPLKVIMYCVII